MLNEKDNGNGMRNQYDVQRYEARMNLPSPYLRHSNHEAEEDVHLRDYLKVIMKRKRIILTFFISVVITVFVLTLMMTPLYKSMVVIRIEKDSPDPLAAAGLKGERDAGYYATQYEILKSETLSERVIKKLNLQNNKDFIPVESGLSKTIKAVESPVTGGLNYLSSILAPVNSEKAAPYVKGAYAEKGIPFHLIKSLISRLEVLPVKNSELVEVSFLSQKPELSMMVANTVAEAYIDYDLDSRIAATEQAKDFLAKQIEIAKTKLEDSEEKLNDYASKNRIIFFDADKQGVNLKRFSDITTALSAATTERMQKEALLRELHESGTNNPVIMTNPLIEELKKQQATLESDYSNLSKTFTSDYPKMQSLEKQISSLSRKIEREKSNILKSLESDYKASLRKEGSFKSAFRDQQRSVLDFQEKAAQYATLKREADVNKELHNGLLQKLNEVSVAAMSKSTSIQVVDRARYPTSPYKPNKTQNLLLAIVFGLMGGIGLAFSVEYFDNTIRDVHDIDKRVNIPTLGMIPFQEETDNSRGLMITHSNDISAFTEAFRSIGVHLLSSSAEPPRSILVTSAAEKEGKTTVCTSTAVALSESVGNGIIIDADLRKPRLHDIFDLDNSAGLSTVLSGKVSFDKMDDSIIRPTSINGLSVMTSGPIPPNPSELLLSARIKDLIEVLGTKFNFVILDSVPLMGMPESVYLSKIVDGTIFVVKGGGTSKDALSEATRIFNNVDAKILGIVLNGAKGSDLKYGPYSYYSSYFKGQ